MTMRKRRRRGWRWRERQERRSQGAARRADNSPVDLVTLRTTRRRRTRAGDVRGRAVAGAGARTRGRLVGSVLGKFLRPEDRPLTRKNAAVGGCGEDPIGRRRKR